MGLFILSRRERPDPLQPAWLAAHRRHGFREPLRLTAGDWRLDLFGALNGLGPQLVQRDNGDFAACTGVFFYRGARGTAGLGPLLDDFDGERFPWSGSRGHFAVIVCKAGRMFLATDALGGYKVYHDGGRTLLSSSFTALRANLAQATPDAQGAWEYAWNGATYGTRTFIREIRQLRRGSLLTLGPQAEISAEYRLPAADAPQHASIDEAAEDYAARLRALFRVYAAGGGRFRTALSGGYDSRLMLALLLDAGLDPQVYVYGRAGDDDVRVAKAIAAGEGLALEHVDKSQTAPPPSAGHTERAWVRFDGWKNDGLFDSGVDAEDRLLRVPGDVSVLNGSAGEVFRNFFYLPDRRYRARDVVWSFYSRHDPQAMTGAFDAEAYDTAMSADLRAAIGADARDDAPLARADIEALYPLHRARYWTARDVGLNQRFGPLLFPYLEPAVFSGTEREPIAWKDYGRLEAKIIERVHPALARYPSAYGFVPADGPDLRYRLKMQLTFLRPTWLRRYSYRLQQRGPLPPRPVWLGDAALSAAGLDPALPHMRALFVPERLRDAEVFNRVCTMELALAGQPLPG